jgi:DNA-binding IclR family transcriptional regulator
MPDMKAVKTVLRALAQLAPTTHTAHDTAKLSDIVKASGLDETAVRDALATAHSMGLCSQVPPNLRVQVSDELVGKGRGAKRTPKYETLDPAIQIYGAGVAWLEPGT